MIQHPVDRLPIENDLAAPFPHPRQPVSVVADRLGREAEVDRDQLDRQHPWPARNDHLAGVGLRDLELTGAIAQAVRLRRRRQPDRRGFAGRKCDVYGRPLSIFEKSAALFTTHDGELSMLTL